MKKVREDLNQRLAEFSSSLHTMDEVRLAFTALKKRFRELERKEAMKALAELNVGDQVAFPIKKWPFIVKGTITGFGPKNVKVQVEDGKPWVVAPSLISKITEEAS